MIDVVRLFEFFKPKSYNLNLIPNKNNLDFAGSVSIDGRLNNNQKTLRLHSKDLNIRSATINNQTCKFKIDQNADELKVELPKNLPNNNLTINIDFKGRITSTLCGLYSCHTKNKKIILATQLESHHARELFPCIDEPEAKAVFGLTLTTPKGEVALANTLPAKIKIKDGLQMITFENTPKMSTYLLAFVVGNLKKLEATTKDGVLVRAWATPEQYKLNQFSLEVAVKSLEFYNDYLALAYPLKKCDIVALPDFGAGAMENWGLLTFREALMLVDPKNTSVNTRQRVAMTVTHEVAHQWFGNLVTMKWWNDLWLNEGFASWIEFLAVDKMFPDWHMWTEFISDEQDVALRQDALFNTHPIEIHISHPDEIRSAFDSISYSKSASIIHMLHEYLGKNDFRLGLIHYLKRHAFGTATTTDLWAALEEVSGKPVNKFMSDWTTQPGFPFVELQPNKNKLKITQKRFCIDKPNSNNELWSIPLLSSQIKKPILDKKTDEVNLPKDLSNFLINKGQSGFYITKYWQEHYQRLGQLVASQKLDTVDRLCLINDSLALSKAGYLPLTDFVSFLGNFKKESNFSVWNCIAIAFSDIRRNMGEEVTEYLKPFAKWLSLAQVNRLGWQELPNESFNDQNLRPTVLSVAANGGNQDVIKEIFDIFNKTKSICDIPANLRLLTLITVSRLGGKQEFNKILKFYESADLAEDKVILAYGLTNFRQVHEYKRAISLIQSKNVRLQDVYHWLASGLVNPKAKFEFWNFIKENWGWLKDNLGSDMSFSRTPVYVARSHSDIKFLKDYSTFFDKVSEPSLIRGIKQGEEIIRSQHAWRQRDGQKLLKFLKMPKL